MRFQLCLLKDLGSPNGIPRWDRVLVVWLPTDARHPPALPGKFLHPSTSNSHRKEPLRSVLPDILGLYWYFLNVIPSFQITKNPNSLAARGLLPSQRLGLTPSPVPFAGHRGLRPPRPQYNFCVFCKNNGEDEKFYMTHTLKDDGGLVRYTTDNEHFT